MPAYNIVNSRGAAVATINIATTTGNTFPIELIGQGISLYGPIIAQNQYFLLENFANSIQPSNPVEGMFWYDTIGTRPNVFDGTNFVPLITQSTSASSAFIMLPAASNLDFTTVGSTPIFTAPGTGVTFYPTSVLLIPTAVVDVSTPAQFNLGIGASEDVLENQLINNPATDRHVFHTMQGEVRSAANVDTINLEVSIAATGGGGLDLRYDVLLFGHAS